MTLPHRPRPSLTSRIFARIERHAPARLVPHIQRIHVWLAWNRGLVGYLILTAAVAYSFYAIQNQKDAAAEALYQSRVQQTKVACAQRQDQAKSSNAQIETLKSIIITGTKSSRAFESTYTKLGLPPYKERLANAEEQAGRLDQFKVELPDCDAAVKAVKRT